MSSAARKAVAGWLAVCLLSASGAIAQTPKRANRRGRGNQPDLKPFHIKGTITGMQGNLIQWTNKNQQQGLVAIDRKFLKRVTVTGSAEPSFLRSGLYMRFTTQPDARGRVTEPVTKLTLFSPDDGFQTGVFPEDPANLKGPVQIAGQIKKLRKTKVTLSVGRKQQKIEIAEKPEIRIEVSDPRLASPGDKIEVNGIGVTVERVYATTIDIELAKPLGGGKKTRGRKKKKSSK